MLNDLIELNGLIEMDTEFDFHRFDIISWEIKIIVDSFEKQYIHIETQIKIII